MLDVPPLQLKAAAGAAFGAATRVQFEDDLAQAPDVSFARLPPAQSLSTMIPASLYASVEQRGRELSINIDEGSRVQPWLVAISLSVGTAALAGTDAANGVDKNLLRLLALKTRSSFWRTPPGRSATLRAHPGWGR